MNRAKLPKKKEKLYKCIGCRGCTKQCLYNGRVAIKRYALRLNTLMICNNATKQSFKDDKLIPEK